MVNGVQNPFSGLGNRLTRAAIGARDPTFFARQQQERDKIRIAVLQTALENLPIDAPNRPELEAQFGQLTGVPTAALAFRPAEPTPESFTLAPGARRFEQRPGQAPVLVAEGREPRGAPLTQVTVGGAPGFGAKNIERQLGEIVETGRQAVGKQANFRQLFDLMSLPETQTGALQPFLTGLQALAAEFGADLDAATSALGLDAGSLENKENFNRVARRIVIDSFEDFKGNLNAREVQIAEESAARLGASEEANIDAIAAGLAAAEIARDRARLANSGLTESEGRALMNRILSDDASEFIARKEEIAAEIQQARGTAVPEQPGLQQRPIVLTLPEGATEIGVDEQGRRIYRLPNGQFLRERR